MEKKKQIIVTCDQCKKIMAMSDPMTLEEAQRMKSRLVMSPFGAPRCDTCKVEPYSDINLAHTIEVVDFSKKRKLAVPV